MRPQIRIRIASLCLFDTSLRNQWKSRYRQEQTSRVGAALCLPQKSTNGTHGPSASETAPLHPRFPPFLPLQYLHEMLGKAIGGRGKIQALN